MSACDRFFILNTMHLNPTVAADDKLLDNGASRKNDKTNNKFKKRRRLRDKTAPRPPHSGKFGSVSRKIIRNRFVSGIR